MKMNHKIISSLLEDIGEEVVIISPWITSSSTTLDILKKAKEIYIRLENSNDKVINKEIMNHRDKLYLVRGLHAKAIIGEKGCIIGSANLTMQSDRNIETIIFGQKNEKEYLIAYTVYSMARDAAIPVRDIVGKINNIDGDIVSGYLAYAPKQKYIVIEVEDKEVDYYNVILDINKGRIKTLEELKERLKAKNVRKKRLVISIDKVKAIDKSPMPLLPKWRFFFEGHVIEADSDNFVEIIKKAEGYILKEHLMDSNNSIDEKLDDILNNGLAIFGKTGAGKTTLLKLLIEKLKERTDLLMIILDPHNQFDGDVTFHAVSPSREDVLSLKEEIYNYLTSNNSESKIIVIKDAFDDFDLYQRIEEWNEKLLKFYHDKVKHKMLLEQLKHIMPELYAHYNAERNHIEYITFTEVFSFMVESIFNIQKMLPEEKRKRVLLIVDEAEHFFPEGKKKSPFVAKFKMIVNQGRKFKFRPVVATQRLSNINKDVTALPHVYFDTDRTLFKIPYIPKMKGEFFFIDRYYHIDLSILEKKEEILKEIQRVVGKKKCYNEEDVKKMEEIVERYINRKSITLPARDHLILLGLRKRSKDIIHSLLSGDCYIL